MKASDNTSHEELESLHSKQNTELNTPSNDPTLTNNTSLTTENNTASAVHINNSLLSQHQPTPSQAANPAISNAFQQIYLSSYANLNTTRNIWIKRASDIDATKIPFSGEDIHDLKVCILQFFGPDYIGSSAELGFVTVWKNGKKLTPGQMVDVEFLKDVTCENPLLLKNTHQVQNQTIVSSPSSSPRPSSSDLLEIESKKSLSLDITSTDIKSPSKSKDPHLSLNQTTTTTTTTTTTNNDNTSNSSNEKNENDLTNLKQRPSLSGSLQDQNLLKSLQLQSNLLPVNGLTNLNLSNINSSLSLQELSNLNRITNLNNINLLNQLNGGNNSGGTGSNSPNSLRQLNGLTNINSIAQLSQLGGINQLNNTGTSLTNMNSLAPLSGSLGINTIASLNNITATTSATLNTNANGVGMNNIINGLISLQNNSNGSRGLTTTSSFNDNIGAATSKLNPNVANNVPQDSQQQHLLSNTLSEIGSRDGSPVPVQESTNPSHQSDDEDAIDPEEQINDIYPPFTDIPKEIEEAVHRNTNRGWRLITIIETNDIPKFFEDQPQDWRVQRSATDRYPGFLVINYIGGLEGERNNMPSKSLNLTWDPETNDPSSKKYRKAKDLIDKQSMMYGSRFFCKGYPWCPSIVSSLNSVNTETAEFGKGGKKLAKRIKSSLSQSTGTLGVTSSPQTAQSGKINSTTGLYRSGNSILLDGQSNSMKRNFDCIHPENHETDSSNTDKGKSGNNTPSHRTLKISCNATLKIEIYASNLKKAVVYGKNLHGILGPISEFRPSDRIMSEACRAALSKDITYNRFLRQAEAMAIKYNIPKHRIPNRTQIRTFFERSRRGIRVTSFTSNNPVLNESVVPRSMVSSVESYFNQPPEQTNYATIDNTPPAPEMSPTQSHLQLRSPSLTLSNYQTTSLPSSTLMNSAVDDVDVDMYNNSDLGIIKIPPIYNPINSINFSNDSLTGITRSIANDLTTGINRSIFTNHTTSSNSSNSNNNTSSFHSNLFNS
ncbi:hypothetical protein PIROE2DRAFT_13362 [Piromyces sp. E2]|nr:hypothetical protein PIROE2DRAFT_13362 [Piromyces sp. E2]|eukprot:OUM60807.1 hypothetical protein PIROE2DRAFT_13362 [Piromyces sp. E2]